MKSSRVSLYCRGCFLYVNTNLLNALRIIVLLIYVACCNGSFDCIISLSAQGGIVMLDENIKQLRKAKGLSQEELAIKLNVVRQTVSKWENGVSQS